MRRLFADACIVAASMAVAWYFIHADIVHTLTSWTGGSVAVTAFVGGLFFASLFSVAPATVVLGELSQHAGVWFVVGGGALGATLSDYVLFLFISRRLGHHARLLTSGGRWQFIRRALRHSRLRFLLTLVGALFIALPLPDEVGLMLLGVSSVKSRYVLPITFVCNAFGILLICLVARSLS